MTQLALVELLPAEDGLTRGEFLAALRAGLIRRVGSSRNGALIHYELTHAGRVLLGRAMQDNVRPVPGCVLATARGGSRK